MGYSLLIADTDSRSIILRFQFARHFICWCVPKNYSSAACNGANDDGIKAVERVREGTLVLLKINSQLKEEINLNRGGSSSRLPASWLRVSVVRCGAVAM